MFHAFRGPTAALRLASHLCLRAIVDLTVSFYFFRAISDRPSTTGGRRLPVAVAVLRCARKLPKNSSPSVTVGNVRQRLNRSNDSIGGCKRDNRGDRATNRAAQECWGCSAKHRPRSLFRTVAAARRSRETNRQSPDSRPMWRLVKNWCEPQGYSGLTDTAKCGRVPRPERLIPETRCRPAGSELFQSWLVTAKVPSASRNPARVVTPSFGKTR